MTIREKIAAALLQFGKKDLYDAGLALFDVLGYNTSRTERLEDNTFQGFADMFIQDRTAFKPDKALVNEWQQVEFLFQLSEAEMSSQVDMFDTKEFNGTIIESYAFFAIEFKAENYSRSQLAQITREFNKLFDMPAMLIFKHGSTLTLSVINRRLHKRDKSKDVLEKVTLIKDIRGRDPHRAHVEILVDLSFEELHRKYSFSNFVALHQSWTKCLDSKELSKRFYQELANWYFWAMDKVSFPDDLEKDADVRNATNLIRLITRIIFVWFIKEKGLVPDALFNRNHLSKVLKDFNKNTKSHSYYQAILQNLFFGTLNQKMKERAFAKDSGYPANKNEYGVKNLFRYEDKFTINETEVLTLFADIPFLNGGLFDCLDKEDENKKVIYVDGFSRETKKQAILPDYLFFHEEQEIDLNEMYGTRNKRYWVKGLIDLLDSYKFTITENTPLEEEIALDPELLGKVFENLLASYNPETQTTARKQTGSFYTPREIVNYMVDESLLAYLQQKLEEKGHGNCEEQLRDLLSYSEEPLSFDEQQADLLIKAIDDCKILDPACGSGAFPMGILHKLVHILHKLDPKNEGWKERQKAKASKIDDADIRQHTLKDIEDAFTSNELDYGRKLFLIENCIYGVDIQPIAVQIAKLRFFISLIIDQKKQPAKENLGIRSLPNLETKFVAANTLIELEKPAGQGLLRNLEIVKLENELKELRHQYFNARSRKEKLQFQKRDKKLRQEIARCLVDDGWDNSVAQQIVAFNPYDQNSSSPFFDPEWMFGLTDGFDIVIGNPPYVRQENIRDLKPLLMTAGYEVYNATSDLYTYFFELGFKLLGTFGVCSLITSNKWMRAKYATKLRNLLKAKTKLLAIIDFGGVKIFDSASVDTAITIYKKDSFSKNHQLQAISVKSDFNTTNNIAEYLKANAMKVSQNDLEIKAFAFAGDAVKKINDKINKKGKQLKDWDINIKYGIKTGYNEAFIIDNETKEYLCKEDRNNCEVIKPILRGKDIDRYDYQWAEHYIIFLPWHFPLQDNLNISGSSKIAEKAFKENYPVLYRWMIQHKEKLIARNSAEVGIRYEWYALQRCAATYYKDFAKEKIIYKDIAQKLTFALEDGTHYLANTAYFLQSSNNKVLLALLNSKLIDWYYRSISAQLGEKGIRHFSIYIEQLPIVEVPLEQQKLLIELVDTIHNAKKLSTPDVNIDLIENAIDRIVYELYELTPEEIDIVETSLY